MTFMLARFVHALWLGSGAFLIAVAAPAAFRAAPTSMIAADVVGAMLTRWHYIGLAAPLALLGLEWRRARVHVLVIVFLAVVFAAGQAMVDLRIRKIRMTSAVPISELARHDPLRRQFGALHGVSSVLLLLQVACAAAALGLDRDYRAGGAPLSAPALPRSDAGEDTGAPPG